MTISAVLKKELKQAFPEIKFSVTTRKSSDDISVSWELTIGTTATNQAVSEVCKQYETIEYHGNGMNDTGYYSGFSVHVNPTSTQERKEWAVKATETHNFVGTAWDGTRQRFEESDGRQAFHATKQYRKYCDNGVMSELLDEYGREPDSKRQYYEWLAKETQAEIQIEVSTVKPKQVEPEIEPVVEVPIIPIGVYPVHTEVYIKSSFPSLNKQDWITDYHSQASNVCQAKIVKIVYLGTEDYQTFLYSLLSSQEWLAKEGGSSSHYISQKYGDDYDKLFKDKLEADRYRRECYEISILVTDRLEYILVNPEGYDYARYVGLPQHATLEYILEKSNVKLSTSSAAKPVALPKIETNLIAFPTPKQPEAQSVPQPQSQDSDYVQIYQKWVDKLVARGEYSKIKSYDEWYAIASEVM